MLRLLYSLRENNNNENEWTHCVICCTPYEWMMMKMNRTWYAIGCTSYVWVNACEMCYINSFTSWNKWINGNENEIGMIWDKYTHLQRKKILFNNKISSFFIILAGIKIKERLI